MEARRRRGVLRTSHSPGLTLVSIPYLDRQRSGVTLRRHARRIGDDSRKGSRWLAEIILVASSASGYMVRSLQLYIHERRTLATHLDAEELDAK
jgi:hypothetical protein